tara:strand:+ start:211 stop:420 length:210 start_codon:yes stop_codon:yes gene_type:complete
LKWYPLSKNPSNGQKIAFFPVESGQNSAEIQSKMDEIQAQRGGVQEKISTKKPFALYNFTQRKFFPGSV